MPHVVVHPPRQPQLPHGCIHQRVTCATALPCFQVATVTAPPQSLQKTVGENSCDKLKTFTVERK